MAGRLRKQRALVQFALVSLFAIVSLSSGQVMAQNPTEECAAVGLEYVDKIDGINGSGGYSSDEGVDYTVTVTDNPNPAPDSYDVSPYPSTSIYPGYSSITVLAKFGEGGGLSHITICGGLADPTPTDPPPPTNTPEPTVTNTPEPTVTNTPEPTATLPPGVTPTATVPVTDPPATDPPAKTPEPTKPVTTLPKTGTTPEDGDAFGLALLSGMAVLLLGTSIAIGTRTRRR